MLTTFAARAAFSFSYSRSSSPLLARMYVSVIVKIRVTKGVAHLLEVRSSVHQLRCVFAPQVVKVEPSLGRLVSMECPPPSA